MIMKNKNKERKMNMMTTNFDLTNDDLIGLEGLDRKLEDTKESLVNKVNMDGVLVEPTSYRELYRITNGFTISEVGCE